MCREQLKHLTIASLIITVCMTQGGVAAEANPAQNTGGATNVVLITISTLRADHVSCFGYERRTTPNLDKTAKERILFRNAFAASGWMMPAYGSIFTSLYPSTHGATHIDKKLSDKHETMTEILKKNGYYCAGFCCGPRLNRKYGFGQGFDLYDDYSVPMMLESLAFEDEETPDINKKRTNDLINDAAIRWLRKNKHQPFFLFVHYYDNHWDYLPPAPYNQMYDPGYKGPIDGTEIAREPLFSNPPKQEDIEHIIALYDGEVRQTDEDLGEMLECLSEARLWDNSIVIILGDHGDLFYEHGHTSHHGVYDELIHIPLVVSIPRMQAGTKVVNALVSQLDILPTILDYLEIPIPEICRGASFRPLIEGTAGTVNDFVFTEYTGGAAPDTYALRSTRYKYCRQARSEPFAYDLTKDPGEQNKIFAEVFTPDIITLQKALDKLLKENEYRSN